MTQTAAAVAWAILPAAAHPYPELVADYRAGSAVWREVTEDAYGYARDVLPPIYLSGGFMVSEPATHEADAAVYCAFVFVGGRHFARETTRARFAEDRRGLLSALAAEEPAKQFEEFPRR